MKSYEIDSDKLAKPTPTSNTSYFAHSNFQEVLSKSNSDDKEVMKNVIALETEV